MFENDLQGTSTLMHRTYQLQGPNDKIHGPFQATIYLRGAVSFFEVADPKGASRHNFERRKGAICSTNRKKNVADPCCQQSFFFSLSFSCTFKYVWESVYIEIFIDIKRKVGRLLEGKDNIQYTPNYPGKRPGEVARIIEKQG